MADVDEQRSYNETRRPTSCPRIIPADMLMALEHPNLHLTPDERRLFGQLFSAADSDKLGVVTGEVAVKFFEKTRLSPAVLGEVWRSAQRLLSLPRSAKQAAQ